MNRITIILLTVYMKFGHYIEGCGASLRYFDSVMHAFQKLMLKLKFEKDEDRIHVQFLMVERAARKWLSCLNRKAIPLL